MVIKEHPSTRLFYEIEKQRKEIEALKMDVIVLRDLLVRLVNILNKMRGSDE